MGDEWNEMKEREERRERESERVRPRAYTHTWAQASKRIYTVNDRRNEREFNDE